MDHQKLIISNVGEISQPPLHDGQVQGLFLASDGRLLMPVVVSDGTVSCLVFGGVERLRADDFRQGNTILDVTVSIGDTIEMEDVAYAYGLEPKQSVFLLQTMDRLAREQRLVVRVNPSYGCTLVCICNSINIEDNWLTAIAAGIGRVARVGQKSETPSDA